MLREGNFVGRNFCQRKFQIFQISWILKIDPDNWYFQAKLAYILDQKKTLKHEIKFCDIILF